MKSIMETAEAPSDWPADAKAAAILTIIHQLIEELENHRWRAAAQAAMRIPTDRYQGSIHDSLASRFRALAHHEGATAAEIRSRSEAYRGYWTLAAKNLADKLDQRLHEFNSGAESWGTLYRGSKSTSPRLSLPLSFDRSDVLYIFEGRRGIRSITYRWATAHGPVDYYNPTGWYFNEPNAPVEIVPLANCVLDGELVDLPEGGRRAKLRFDRVLQPGDSYFFAYSTIFNSNEPCRPSISYECRGLYLRSFTIRAQFDVAAMPRKCWHFNMGPDGEGHEPPEASDPRLLTISSQGYTDYEFMACERGRRYGLRWLW